MEDLRDPRKTFGEALVDAAEKNQNIVALPADSSSGSGMTAFHERFPERHIEFGIMEQGIIGFSAGLATTGKIPFVVAIAPFVTARPFEMFRNAIGNRNMVSDMYLSSFSNWHSMKKHSNSIGSIKVKVQTLDTFMVNKKYPNFIRMDVEGYEHKILPQAIRDMKHVHSWQIEIHRVPQWSASAIDIILLFINEGFEFIVDSDERDLKDQKNWSFANPNNVHIIARRKWAEEIKNTVR